MASKINIANHALIQVGVEPLTALDNTTDAGRKVLAAWDMVLAALLEEHAWGFATKRVDLQQLATAPVYGYDHAYQVPSDCLRVLEIYPDTEYQLESGAILSNEDELSLKYIYLVTQTGYFTPWFALAMGDALAARICFALEGSVQKMQYLEKMALMSLEKAKVMDCKQAYADPGPGDETESWLTSRGYSASDSENAWLTGVVNT